MPTGVEMRICEPANDDRDRVLRDVEQGRDGEICISGPSVISGYDGGASPESFVDGWFRTGDLGHFDRDGYLCIAGRLRDVINRGGEKISPLEVERVLLAHPAVRDTVVVAEPDPVYGQRAVAYVVPQRQGMEGLEGFLRSHARERLAGYKVPSSFVIVDELPRTATGKVRRRLVGQRASDEQTRKAA